MENLFSDKEPSIDDSLREKLISLAGKGKINYSVKYIQKQTEMLWKKLN